MLVMGSFRDLRNLDCHCTVAQQGELMSFIHFERRFQRIFRHPNRSAIWRKHPQSEFVLLSI